MTDPRAALELLLSCVDGDYHDGFDVFISAGVDSADENGAVGTLTFSPVNDWWPDDEIHSEPELDEENAVTFRVKLFKLT